MFLYRILWMKLIMALEYMLNFLSYVQMVYCQNQWNLLRLFHALHCVGLAMQKYRISSYVLTTRHKKVTYAC